MYGEITVNFQCNLSDMYPSSTSIICKKISGHSRDAKNTRESKNGPQNVTVIGIKFEEVHLLQNKKRA